MKEGLMKKSYYTLAEGWVSGTHFAANAEVKLLPQQAEYYLLAGQLTETPPPATAPKKAKGE